MTKTALRKHLDKVIEKSGPAVAANLLNRVSDRDQRLKEPIACGNSEEAFIRQPSNLHYHTDKKLGITVRCYHACRNNLLSASFWVGTAIGTMVSFPLEHYLYEKVWPFTLVTRWMGL